jgi:hypothetical protein
MYNWIEAKMTTLSADTDPRIEKIQIEMHRQVSPARKMRMVAQMNQTVKTFMLAGLKQRNPEATPETLRRMLAALLLGDELAQKVYDYHA